MSAQANKAMPRSCNFPTYSSCHGAELATIRVGEEPNQHTFHVHKHLLSHASSYFDRALNGMFKESSGTLDIKHHCPIAFEAVYQWLYSGQVLGPKQFESFPEIRKYYYHLEDNWQQLFYLRLLKLADETMIPALKLHAYERLTRDFFGEPPSAMPETNFLKEVFDADSDLALLPNYLVDYGAWIISHKRCRDRSAWARACQDVPKYGALVAQVVLWHMVGELDETEQGVHPAKNLAYKMQNLEARPLEGWRRIGDWLRK